MKIRIKKGMLVLAGCAMGLVKEVKGNEAWVVTDQQWEDWYPLAELEPLAQTDGIIQDVEKALWRHQFEARSNLAQLAHDLIVELTG